MDRRRHVRKSRIGSLSALLAVGAISMPLLASTTAAVAASPRTTPPIGKQLAELKGSDTVAGDYFGYSVAISGTTAIVGAYGHTKDAGLAYVFTKRAGVWKQTAELKGYDTVAGDYFGYSVAISGATAIVGAYGHASSAGRAYVFSRTATRWKQTAELKGSDTVAERRVRRTRRRLRHDRRRGRGRAREWRPGVRVHQDGGRLETGRRVEGLRHRRRR